MDPTDLITLDDARVALSEVNLTAAQLAYLPALITAASNAVSRYCGDRDFIQQQYDEIFRIGMDGCVSLPQIPVLKVSRIAAGRTPALTVTNLDNINNQRATIEYVCSGDEVIGITYTGVLLTTVASAVVTTTELDFTDYLTVADLAEAIGAAGAGWSSDVATDYGPWPTTELIAEDDSVQDCFEGADLTVWGLDLAGCKVRKNSGILDVSRGRVLGIDGPRWGPGWEQFALGDREGFGRVRVIYTGGFVTVPPMIQKATAMTVAAMASALQTDPRLSGESDGQDRWDLASEFATFVVPPAAQALCWPYVIHHA